MFQYQAAAEAGVFQASPYGPFPPEILPPVVLPPYTMDKVKAPKVKAKRAPAKPKTDKEPKPATAAAAKAQKPAVDSTGLYLNNFKVKSPVSTFKHYFFFKVPLGDWCL